ncbi:MAG: T9SS type A sorting domain-containing protein [Flavobacteriaceae bacterium]|nr:T9SS type A sorting domain-containing protein [Flavobacteriaceae bacterium]
MRSKLLWFVCICLFLSANSLFAQQVENKPQKAKSIGLPSSVEYISSLSSRSNLIIADLSEEKEMADGRSWTVPAIAGKGSTGDDILSKNPHPLKNALQSRGLNDDFEAGASNSSPTDPAGAVGPNHYFAVINTAFRIFDKSGTALTAQLDPTNIFPASGCCDLTISYDSRADRWVITMLGSGAQLAVSDGPDPVNDGWYVYTYPQVQDYQKLSVWSDGYYMTENTVGSTQVHVFEREKMLIGDPGAQIVSFALPGLITSGFFSPQAFNITDNNYPDVGAAPIVYLADDAWGGVIQDHIKLWTIDMDWDNVGNSTVSAQSQIGVDAGTGTVTPFTSVFDGGSFSNLQQPNFQLIDALQATIMNQAQFRWFPTHRSALFNFVVDTDGTVGKIAGIRWYELRQDGDGLPWYVFQEGTYNAPGNKHAWNASLAMDSEGNIALGYTGMGVNPTDGIFAGTYYTGRFAGDPPGTMTVAETTIRAGNGNFPNNRYGDYSKIDVDPVNDKEFWFNNEIMFNGRKNWVGVFQIASDKTNDVGVVALESPLDNNTMSATQVITVTLYNYGSSPASNFDVAYQIDGGTVVTETYTGTLAANSSESFSFSTTADMSAIQKYFVFAETKLSGDQDTGNDFTICYVRNIAADDIGVTDITSPVSAEGLGTESITVAIRNFGGNAQSNFDVSYILDAGSPVVETVPGPLNPGATISYTFTAAGDFSSLGDHSLSAKTELPGDSDTSNDEFVTTVSNLSCTSVSNNTSQPIGPDAGSVTTSVVTFTEDFVVDDVNVTVNLVHTWNADLEIRLIAPGGAAAVWLCRDVGGSSDNMVNTVFDDEAGTPIASGNGPFTGSFIPEESLMAFDGLSSLGDWTLEITDDANFDGGTFNSFTLQLCENVNLSLDDQPLDAEVIVIHEGNDRYLIKLPTNTLNDRLQLSVLNVLGQQIYWRTVDNENGTGYEHRLDMSYVSSGMYFVKIGNANASVIKRIIVE